MTPYTERPLEASVIITTHNRSEALLSTLRALDRQGEPVPDFEILVTDDGSTDDTYELLRAIELRVPLCLQRHETARGVAAGLNLAIEKAHGRHLILLGDDLLVRPDFVRLHLETLRRYPGYWVVGAFEQRPALGRTTFGRYVHDLEESVTRARLAKKIGAGLWELHWPTARNLSLPRADFDFAGPFDVRFRSTCQNQDLALRAKDLGVRFLYNEAIASMHNDQTEDLRGFCRTKRQATHDTALFCAKYPEMNREVPLMRECGPRRRSDGRRLALRKSIKAALSNDVALAAALRLIALSEAVPLPEAVRRKLYRTLIGLHTFRGWREGLQTLRTADGALGQLLSC